MIARAVDKEELNGVPGSRLKLQVASVDTPSERYDPMMLHAYGVALHCRIHLKDNVLGDKKCAGKLLDDFRIGSEGKDGGLLCSVGVHSGYPCDNEYRFVDRDGYVCVDGFSRTVASAYRGRLSVPFGCGAVDLL